MKHWQCSAKTIGLFLLISCAIVTAAAAQQVTVMGAGADANCGKWLSERQQRDFLDMACSTPSSIDSGERTSAWC